MDLSRRAQYALLAVTDLAVQGGTERVQLRDIAARQQIPEKYLEQLLRPLRTAGVIRSTRGSRGGYQLARPAREITVREVLEAVEGALLPEDSRPPRHPGGQVIHELWRHVAEQVGLALDAITVATLAQRYQARAASDDNWVI